MPEVGAFIHLQGGRYLIHHAERVSREALVYVQPAF